MLLELLASAALTVAVTEASITGTFDFQRVGEDTWQARYCFETPVEAFKFERPMSGDMRQNYWRPANVDFELAYETVGRESVAYIRRVDGEAFSCAGLTIDTYTKLPEKNYLAFSKFSDAGRFIYTGYYSGAAFVGGAWQATHLRASYTPLPGNNVAAREPDALDYQYIYFGPQAAEAKNGAITIVDPAIPQAARDAIFTVIPETNQEMQALLGAEQSGTYTVFLAGGELTTLDGYSIKAGVQENQIAFTMKGRGVIDAAAKDTTRFAKQSAHEVIHLWQGEVWPALGDDHPWMHEGSADALAFEVMRRRGYYDQDRYDRVWAKVEEDCVDLLSKSSVHGGPEAGNFYIVYRCGALVNWLAGAVINPSDPGAGAWEIWRQMAAQPEAERLTDKSEELYFATLSKMGLGEPKRAALRRFLESKPDNPAEAVTELKHALGL